MKVTTLSFSISLFVFMSQEIIKKYGILAKKSLGQNFLVDDKKLSEIWSVLDIWEKNIVEVWPGYGALTEKLLDQKPTSLHLVELDRDMVDILQDRFYQPSPSAPLPKGEGSFKIYHQDVLEYVPEFQEYSVIANIPYYITSPILRHFLYDTESIPENMLILMQKDVADKIVWKGKNKSSVLSLMVQKKCKVEEKVYVPKECFSPVPKVESSVVLFQKHNRYQDVDDGVFLGFIKIWFLAPRKKLTKNLVSWWYDKKKIEEFLRLKWRNVDMRPEDGDIWFWVNLYKELFI